MVILARFWEAQGIPKINKKIEKIVFGTLAGFQSDLGSDFEAIFKDFGAILDRFWKDFRGIWEEFGEDAWSFLEG